MQSVFVLFKLTVFLDIIDKTKLTKNLFLCLINKQCVCLLEHSDVIVYLIKR
jgi:hypothetical protein